MVKYTETEVVFAEIPNEITLAINISNCPHHCVGCHSPYLQGDVGEELTYEVLDALMEKNEGITCVSFMGEGKDLNTLFLLGMHIKTKYGIKVAIYSGSKDVPEKFWDTFDYIKLGKYDEKLGPLNNPTTNQRLYKKDVGCRYFEIVNDMLRPEWIDITNKFWGKNF